MPKSTFKIIQILITIALLGLVLHQAGLFTKPGQTQFIELLATANIKWLVASILLGVVVNMVSSFKWYCLIHSQGMQAGFGRVFAYYVVGQFYNLFLPTSVGGDVVRSYELGKFTGQQARSLASVFVERYTGMLTLLAVAVVATLSQLSRFNQDFIIVSLVGFTLVLGLMAWLVIDLRPYYAVSRCLRAWHSGFDRVFEKLDKLVVAVSKYGDDKKSLLVAFANSLLFYLFAVINVYVTALIFEANVNLVDILIATPIIMLIMNIPISIGNLGLMEFAYINVLQIMGYSPALGLSIAITMRLKSLIDGALGGILHPIFVTHKHE